VITSPRHLAVVERRGIIKLFGIDCIVACCAGQGFPLIRKGRKFRGVKSEIGKGRASAKLSEEINTHMLMVPSGVKGAAIPTPRVFTVSGMDIVEVSPQYGHAEIPALVTETPSLDLLCVLVSSRKKIGSKKEFDCTCKIIKCYYYNSR